MLVESLHDPETSSIKIGIDPVKRLAREYGATRADSHELRATAREIKLQVGYWKIRSSPRRHRPVLTILPGFPFMTAPVLGRWLIFDYVL